MRAVLDLAKPGGSLFDAAHIRVDSVDVDAHLLALDELFVELDVDLEDLVVVRREA